MRGRASFKAPGALDGMVELPFPPEMRGDQFGVETPVPDDAAAMATLVGTLGRRP